MSTYILTSMFPNGFPVEVAEQLKRIIEKRSRFAFVASEFEKAHEKTDRYYNFFMNMFISCGIEFEHAFVVDSRMTVEQMQNRIEAADVIWLAGGNTSDQYQYFEKCGLIPIIREHKGVIFGMSAGAINMAKIAVCSVTGGSSRKLIYNGLGLVDISVEPHFNKRGASEELLQISKQYPIYGLCDDSVIVCDQSKTIFIGDIFLINQGCVTKIS